MSLVPPIVPIYQRPAPGVPYPPGAFTKVHIDLSTANIDKEFSFSGDYMYVDASSGKYDGTTKIRFNSPNGDQLNLFRGKKFRILFDKFYISNSGVGGAFADVVIGHHDQTDIALLSSGEIASDTLGFNRAGGVWTPIDARTIADGMQFNPGGSGVENALEVVGVTNLLWNPAGQNYQLRRTPSKFGTAFQVALAAGGHFTAWTPPGGKAFRLMGFRLIQLIPGTPRITLYDGATFGAAAAFYSMAQNGPDIGEEFPGNGYLSVASGNSLFIGSDGGPGDTLISFWGTEE